MSTQTVASLPILRHLACERHPDQPVFRTVAGTRMCERCYKGTVPGEYRIPKKKRGSYAQLAETKAMIAPFLQFVGAPQCVKCGGERKKLQKLCDACSRRWGIVAAVKSWLRAYRKTGEVKRLQNAAAMIRRHKIEPKELGGC